MKISSLIPLGASQAIFRKFLRFFFPTTVPITIVSFANCYFFQAIHQKVLVVLSIHTSRNFSRERFQMYMAKALDFATPSIQTPFFDA